VTRSLLLELYILFWFPVVEYLGMAQSIQPPNPSIAVQNLSYRFPDRSAGLHDVQLDLPPGSRTLLIGGNSQKSQWH